MEDREERKSRLEKRAGKELPWEGVIPMMKTTRETTTFIL
jgi:hypothetical protein